jgi:hypothetical protein
VTDDLTADIPEELILISEFQGSLSTFSCGSDPLDEFIQEQAHEFSERLLGETWLLCDGDDVAAFYTLAPASVPNDDYTGDETPEFGKLDDIPYPIPALLIARFGVAEEYQNQSIGSTLVDYIIVGLKSKIFRFGLSKSTQNPNQLDFTRV